VRRMQHCHGHASAADDAVRPRYRKSRMECPWDWADDIARQINDVLLALLDAHRHRSSSSAACPMKVELRSNAVLESDPEFPLCLEAWADEGRKEYYLKLKTWVPPRNEELPPGDSMLRTVYERTHQSKIPQDDGENYDTSDISNILSQIEKLQMTISSASCGGRGELRLNDALKEVITTGLWIQCTCDFIPSSEATLWNCWNAPRRKDIPVKLGFRHLDVAGGLRGLRTYPWTQPSTTTRPSTTIVLSSTKRQIAQEEGERKKRRRAWLSIPRGRGPHGSLISSFRSTEWR